MTCTHRCNQGRTCDCAITTFYAETEGVMPMATGCSTKAAPRPAPKKPGTKSTLAWFAVLVVSTALAALCVRLVEQILN